MTDGPRAKAGDPVRVEGLFDSSDKNGVIERRSAFKERYHFFCVRSWRVCVFLARNTASQSRSSELLLLPYRSDKR